MTRGERGERREGSAKRGERGEGRRYYVYTERVRKRRKK